VKLPDGQWASNGAAYDAFLARMKPLGANGFRAVLWHQGESDANQKDATRTLTGKLYREHLEKIIRDSSHAIGWDAPWFVAAALKVVLRFSAHQLRWLIRYQMS